MAFTSIQNSDTHSTTLINIEQISSVDQTGSNAVKIRMTNGDIINSEITYEQFWNRVKSAIDNQPKTE